MRSRAILVPVLIKTSLFLHIFDEIAYFIDSANQKSSYCYNFPLLAANFLEGKGAVILPESFSLLNKPRMAQYSLPIMPSVLIPIGDNNDQRKPKSDGTCLF